MSHFDYQISKKIAGQDFPFYSLIMAAMRQADTGNMAKLTNSWPEVAAELRARYNAPGGLLLGSCCEEGKCGVCAGPAYGCEHQCHSNTEIAKRMGINRGTVIAALGTDGSEEAGQ